MARVVRIFERLRNHPVDGMGPVPDRPVADLVVDTATETWSNCFFWALIRWLRYGGAFVIVDSPAIPVWRALWAPKGVNKGPLYHFHPTTTRSGLAGIWAAFWHKGKPRNMRPRWDD